MLSGLLTRAQRAMWNPLTAISAFQYHVSLRTTEMQPGLIGEQDHSTRAHSSDRHTHTAQTTPHSARMLCQSARISP